MASADSCCNKQMRAKDGSGWPVGTSSAGAGGAPTQDPARPGPPDPRLDPVRARPSAPLAGPEPAPQTGLAPSATRPLVQSDPRPSPAAAPSVPTDRCELEVIPPPSAAARVDGAPDSPGGARIAAGWLLALSASAVLSAVLQFATGQTERGFFLLSLCLVVVFAATWSDVATRRIPNVLTYPAILLGLGLNALLPLVLERVGASTALVMLGSSGTLDALQGFGLCAIVGVVSFMARGLGGGDVKLLAAVGALLGFHVVVAVLFNTLLIAALLGVVNWFAGGSLMRRLQSFAHAIYFSVVMRADMRSVYRFRPTEGPFALSLFAGLVLAQFYALHREIFGVTW